MAGMTAKPAVRLRATALLLVLALVAPQMWAATHAPGDKSVLLAFDIP